MTRSLEEAAMDWAAAISRELHTRNLIHKEKVTEAVEHLDKLDIKTEVTTRTVVSRKWIFIR